MSNRFGFYNISDKYGNAFPVTVDDYRELNPEGSFSQGSDEIFEIVDDVSVVVATQVNYIQGHELRVGDVMDFYGETGRVTKAPDESEMSEPFVIEVEHDGWMYSYPLIDPNEYFHYFWSE